MGILTEAAEALLRRLCPMRDGVAYMPVPRCETCRHWKPDPSYATSAGGTCKGGRPDSIWSDCGDWTIYTAADFGCVRFEPRP